MYGHRRADCRRRARDRGTQAASVTAENDTGGEATTAAVYYDLAASDEDGSWCFALSATEADDSGKDQVDITGLQGGLGVRAVSADLKDTILIDSGSDEHVCKRGFAPGFAVEHGRPDAPVLRDVQQRVLPVIWGEAGGVGARSRVLSWCLANEVGDNVLSLGRLLRKGFEFDLSLDRGCVMRRGGRQVPLHLRRNSLRVHARAAANLNGGLDAGSGYNGDERIAAVGLEGAQEDLVPPDDPMEQQGSPPGAASQAQSSGAGDDGGSR